MTASGTTGWTPDSMDQLDTRTDPLGRAERSTYDAGGNLATFTDRKGQVTTLTYDALNGRPRRCIKTARPPATPGMLAIV